MKKQMVIPFSSGTEGMNWYANNCSECKRAYLPKDGNYPSDKTMRNYVSCGKECKMKFAIDYGFITGEVDSEIIDLIGRNEHGWIAQSCRFFSDDDNDRYKAPKRPRPDAPNQMVMPFILDEIGLPDRKKELV